MNYRRWTLPTWYGDLVTQQLGICVIEGQELLHLNRHELFEVGSGFLGLTLARLQYFCLEFVHEILGLVDLSLEQWIHSSAFCLAHNKQRAFKGLNQLT